MKPKKIKKTKLDVGTLTEKILEFFKSGSPLTFAEARSQYYGLPVHKREVTYIHSPKQLYNIVDKIRRRGWLEKKIVQDQVYYCLTAKGRTKQLLFQLRSQSKQRGKQATIIIFDIPEEKRTFRNFLRRLLKQMKFTMIQKSVFITPNILPQEFYDLLAEMKLMEYVKVIEGQVRYH